MLNSQLLSRPMALPVLPEYCSVVLADLSQSVIEDKSATSLLSQAELARSASYRFIDRRQLYIQCRALLRVLLAERIGLPAEEIAFDEGPFGKPVLAGPVAESGIHFNISHSGSLALIALSSHLEVGVDIERCKPGRDLAGIADHFFAPTEQQALQATCETGRDAAFYSCWCRKESFAKATGLGMQLPFDRFSVNIDPIAPARLLSLDDNSWQIDQWQMHTLMVPAGYFAALTLACAVD